MFMITPLPNDDFAPKLPDINEAVQRAKHLVWQINELNNDILSISTDPDPALLVIRKEGHSMLEQARRLSCSLQVLQNCRNKSLNII